MSARKDAVQCSAVVYDGGYSRGHNCNKRASVERDGRAYCGTHDPVRRRERQEVRNAEFRAECRARSLQVAVLDAERALADAVMACNVELLPPLIRDARRAVEQAQRAAEDFARRPSAGGRQP